MKYKKLTGYTKKELEEMIKHGMKTEETTTYYFNGKHIFKSAIQDRITVICRTKHIETIKEGLARIEESPEWLTVEDWNKEVHEYL